MQLLDKTAIFLLLIGAEKGQKVISLMDTGEIKAVMPAIRRVSKIEPAIQTEIWQEFADLGYEASMSPAEILTIVRFLFAGSRIERNKEACFHKKY